MLWVDIPQGGSLGKLRGSVHQDHDMLDTGGWTTRSLWHRSQCRTGSAWHTTMDMEEKKYNVIHPCRMPNFHPHILMDPELWLLHMQRCEKATNKAQGAVIYHFRWYFHLSLPRRYIRWAIISPTAELFPCYDGPSLAQPQNCFHAYRGMIVLAGVTHLHANSK